MESAGAASDSNWSSFSSAASTDQDPEIMALLFGSTPFPEEPQREQSLEMPSSTMYWHDHEAAHPPNYCSSNASTTGGFAHSSWPSQHVAVPPHDIESYYLSDPAAAAAQAGGGGRAAPMDFFVAVEKSSYSVPSSLSENLLEESCFDQKATGGGGREEDRSTQPSSVSDLAYPKARTPKRTLPLPGSERGNDNKNISAPSSKKKSRLAAGNELGRQTKRIQKSARNSNSEDCNIINGTAILTRHNSASFSSEDDLSLSQDTVDGEENSGGKASKMRAGRGSATDPQSLYARKRRERINERLKILQSLVPNGTKVDISTMLEEAVQYVKFLQLQIKLLSSDDLWMYAPIAYNGMDIGLDLKISPPQ